MFTISQNVVKTYKFSSKKTRIFSAKMAVYYCLLKTFVILLSCISIDIGGVCPEVGFAQTTARKHRFKSPNGAGEKVQMIPFNTVDI